MNFLCCLSRSICIEKDEYGMMEQIEQFVSAFSGFMWGMPLLILLLGGGLFLVIYSKFEPLKYFKHAFQILGGRFDKSDDKGKINHFQALASSLAATIGMGNISGVALAIATGGPGALFWMWISALIGVTTKFFTVTLAVMFRKKDENGNVEGGPMYVITEGLGQKWKALAYIFAIGGFVGAWPVFTANQLTQIIREQAFQVGPMENMMPYNIGIGITLAILVFFVIIGGLKRIANIASMLVPFMVVVYFFSVLLILGINYEKIPSSFMLIFEDAFSATSVLGGAVGSIIITGARRAAFSNEAGIGTAPMIHGDAKTNEPVQEGLVAMLGPLIDTIVICTLTALAIIVTGVWDTTESSGIGMTIKAFEVAMPGVGGFLLLFSTAIFGITSLFTHNFYGNKCLAFMKGDYGWTKYYNIFYVCLVLVGALFSLVTVINLIDGFFAVMAVPTMVSTLLLAPKAKKEMLSYFKKYKEGKIKAWTNEE